MSPIVLAKELCERAVEPDRLVRVVLPSRTDEEEADQSEDDSAGQVSDHSHEREDAILGLTHLPQLQVLAEASSEAPPDVERARAQDPEADRSHQPAPERVLHHPRREPIFLARAAGLVGAGQHGGGDREEPEVPETPGRIAEALPPALLLASLERPAEERLDEAPGRIAQQADRKQGDRQLCPSVVSASAERAPPRSRTRSPPPDRDVQRRSPRRARRGRPWTRAPIGPSRAPRGLPRPPQPAVSLRPRWATIRERCTTNRSMR